MTRASIKDVAAAAGVSIKTVSRVINGVPTVDEAIRRRVNAAIEDLHYLPNGTARSLRAGSSDTISIVVDSIDDVFFAALASAVEDTAAASGFGVVIASSGHAPEREREQLLRLIGQGVRGAVLAPVAERHPYLDPYRSAFPIVTVDRRSPEFDSVTIDDRGAARHAVDALIDGGHQRIAMIGWNSAYATARERRRGYEDALLARGWAVDPTLVPEVPAASESARTTLTALLQLTRPPTALFLSNARHAAVTVAAMHSLGRTDLPVISFGDFLLADTVKPSISCVDQDPREIGHLATSRLLERLATPDLAVLHHVAPSWFISRDSHRAPAAPAVVSPVHAQ